MSGLFRKTLPSAFLKTIRFSSHSSNLFSLFAPTVDEVHLVSSFTRWQNVPLSKDQKTGVFQLPSSVPIPDGEHRYKFFVRKNAKEYYWTSVIDPYVERYDAKRRHGLITIRNGKKYRETYDWQYDHVKLPDNEKLIIYELYVADFTEQGTFKGVRSKIPYLADLGINAIELMPLHEYAGDEHNWGYSPTHHFALKTNYGTAKDLKKLVDQCHQHGIRVFMDGIFNHSSLECPLVLIDKQYWYYKDKHHPDDPFYWGPEFNYDYYDENLRIKPAVKYAQDIVRYWVEEFHLDGIRFDAAKQMANYDILRDLDRTARSVRSNQPFYTQAEHVPEKLAITKFHQGPVDACWSSTFHGVLAEALTDKDKFQLDLLKYIISATHLVNYLTCHDNEHLMSIIHRVGRAAGVDALQRARLGAIVLLTSVGIPLIWQGDELGDARAIVKQSPHRQKLPMQWSLLNEQLNANLFQIFRRLIQLRHSLISDDQSYQVNFFCQNYEDRILAYTRLNNELMVITHFTDQMRNNYQIADCPLDGRWVDWLTNESYSVENNRMRLDLKPFDGKVLLRQK